MAASVTGLLLVERLAMDYLLPPMAPTLAASETSFGRTSFMVGGGAFIGSVAYWGIGGLFALPACLHVEK